MITRFRVDPDLLNRARQAFGRRRGLYWILGGSCTGKSTVAAAIAALTGMARVDMDSYIYGQFQPLYQADRHPASTAWFGEHGGLAWVLSLGWDAFDSLNRATNAEFLDLLVDVAADSWGEEAIVVDGGLSYPSILAQVLTPDHLVCLEAGDAIRARTWETAAERAEMKGWVQALPDGLAKWQQFLYFDKMIAETMVEESRSLGVPVIQRDEASSVETTVTAVLEALALKSAD